MLHDVRAALKHLLIVPGQQQEFKLLGIIDENHVQREQLKILHDRSGIECIVQFGAETTISYYQKQTEIILNYMSLSPVCKSVGHPFLALQ